MASKYLKATGNWANNNTWSATDGGAAGATYPVAGDNVFITANGNGKTLTMAADAACDSLVSSGATSAVFAGTATITVGGNVTLLATMTVPNTITWTITGTGNFAGSTLATIGAINLNGTAHTVSGAFTFTVMTRNGTATNANSIIFTSGTTITGTTTAMIGNSRANQLAMNPSTLGSAYTITTTNWKGTTNVDIMDCTATNAVDFSAAGLNILTIGNAGGNTGITFPAAAAQTYTDTGDHKASTAANWTSRIPLVGIDDITIGASITDDMPRMGKSITVTAGTFTKSQVIAIYGSLNLTGAAGFTGNFLEELRGRGNYTFNNGGLNIYSFSVYATGGNYSCTFTGTIGTLLNTLYNGTLTFNGQTFTQGRLNASGAAVKVLDITNSIITSATTSVTVWDMSPANTTLISTGSTLIFSNSSATTQTFAGGGLTYNNVIVAGAGNYALTVTGNNTAKWFIDASAAAKSIIGTGTTQTVLSMGRDTGTNVVTITGGTWNKTTPGLVTMPYANLTGVPVSPANTFYAGKHSTDGGGNTNWIFGNPPSGSIVKKLMAAGVI